MESPTFDEDCGRELRSVVQNWGDFTISEPTVAFECAFVVLYMGRCHQTTSFCHATTPLKRSAAILKCLDRLRLGYSSKVEPYPCRLRSSARFPSTVTWITIFKLCIRSPRIYSWYHQNGTVKIARRLLHCFEQLRFLAPVIAADSLPKFSPVGYNMPYNFKNIG